MYLSDYHLHTHYSFDSEAGLDDICQTAIANGINEIALTDHLDIFDCYGYGGREDYEKEMPLPINEDCKLDCVAWYKEINEVKAKYKGRLEVRLGIEAGTPQYNSEEYKKFCDKYPLDFTIGSVHNMPGNIDVYYHDFHKVDYKGLYERYNELLLELAMGYDFDVLGHLTYPSRYIESQLGIKVDLTAYTDFYKELFKVLKERGKGIELNTSGIARGGDSVMPDMWIIELYASCGGEVITIGSDSHVPNQVGTTARRAIELLKGVGFKYYTTYQNHNPKFIKI